jgi:predicted dehydrogenase
MQTTIQITRRNFLKTTMAGAAGAVALPTIVPSSVFGASAPSNLIRIAQIGCGRIGRDMDMPGLLKHPDVARIVALCDLDSKRLGEAKTLVEQAYAKKKDPIKAELKLTGDYRELLDDKSIDAVSISTPDHWHSEPVVAFALAGKDIYVQKPLSMTIKEGRQVSDVVQAKKRAFQIGSQQRSGEQFRRACELVRNGRIGKIHTIRIGLPTDPSGGSTTEMPIPSNLNYDMWLGCTPQVFYTEDRVHPQKDYSRPGYLRLEAHCLGMITGWGSHHVDIGHWGMGTELTGPIEATARAEFPKSGLWNVHGPYHIEMKYANGVTMIIDNTFPNGIKFEGSEGWVFTTRGGKTTASDPASSFGKALDASSPEILRSEIKSSEIHLHVSNDHHLDWLQSIKTRKPAVTTPEEAHRSTSACMIGWIAMKLGRTIKWDPVREEFPGDAEANAFRSRLQRAPYGTDALLKNVKL